MLTRLKMIFLEMMKIMNLILKKNCHRTIVRRKIIALMKKTSPINKMILSIILRANSENG
jgi:hypothetical protein